MEVSTLIDKIKQTKLELTVTALSISIAFFIFLNSVFSFCLMIFLMFNITWLKPVLFWLSFVWLAFVIFSFIDGVKKVYKDKLNKDYIKKYKLE